jgi:ADP-ribosylglycohydrolase
MNFQDKIKASITTAIFGDAMGVPVESEVQIDNSLCSVKNMLGYGRFDQPQGTWSDDSAMILCTIDSLVNGYDIEHIGKTFCRWLFDSYWTANGLVFDSGLTTFFALDRIRTEGAMICHEKQ